MSLTSCEDGLVNCLHPLYPSSHSSNSSHSKKSKLASGRYNCRNSKPTQVRQTRRFGDSKETLGSLFRRAMSQQCGSSSRRQSHTQCDIVSDRAGAESLLFNGSYVSPNLLSCSPCSSSAPQTGLTATQAIAERNAQSFKENGHRRSLVSPRSPSTRPKTDDYNKPGVEHLNSSQESLSVSSLLSLGYLWSDSDSDESEGHSSSDSGYAASMFDLEECDDDPLLDEMEFDYYAHVGDEPLRALVGVESTTSSCGTSECDIMEEFELILAYMDQDSSLGRRVRRTIDILEDSLTDLTELTNSSWVTPLGSSTSVSASVSDKDESNWGSQVQTDALATDGHQHVDDKRHAQCYPSFSSSVAPAELMVAKAKAYNLNRATLDIAIDDVVGTLDRLTANATNATCDYPETASVQATSPVPQRPSPGL